MRYWFIFVLFILLPSLCAAQDTAQRIMVEYIKVTGNKVTKRNIIIREIGAVEGTTIPTDSLPHLLTTTKQRLANTGLFNEIHVTLDTVSPTVVHLYVAVKERWYVYPEVTFQLADRNFNVWWNEMNHDLRRTIIGVNFTHQNFRGNRERLSVGGQIGYTRRVTLNYEKPFVDRKQRHGFGVSFSLSENAETYYATDSNKLQFAKSLERPMRRIGEGAIAYTYRPGYNSFHVVRLGYRYSKVDDSIIGLNPNYYENGSNTLRYIDLSYRLEINRTDNWIYPLRGDKTIVNAAFYYGLEGLSYQALITLEHGAYKQLGRKWFGSTVFRGRLMVPQAAPYAGRGALGTKYEYVRGYEYYVIDGYQYGLLRGNFKRELLNKTNILRLPFRYLSVIPLRVYPKIFADAGYVTNPHPGNSFLNNKLLYSAGIGVDVVTIYDIKIRAEYSINHLGQKGLFLHFSSE